MKTLTIFAFVIIFTACSSSNNSVNSSTNSTNTRTKTVELLNNETYYLTEISTDKTYGYTEKNPIKVGGVHEKEGPLNERRFLNALFGPNNIKVMYSRVGSCCQFKSPNGLINNMGLLDIYKVYEIGSKDTVNLYFNIYDSGNLQIPVGFKAKEK
jgi:hypothetical protein